MPNGLFPAIRLPDTPPSPPKNSGNISDIAHTSSPTPKVIIANGVAAFLVVTQPNTTATSIAATPPTIGVKLTGSGQPPDTKFSV